MNPDEKQYRRALRAARSMRGRARTGQVDAILLHHCLLALVAAARNWAACRDCPTAERLLSHARRWEREAWCLGNPLGCAE